jgi:hypothetical protein
MAPYTDLAPKRALGFMLNGGFTQSMRRHGLIIGEDNLIDQTAIYSTDRESSGAWFSNVPLDENHDVEGDTLIELLVDTTETKICDFECVEEGTGYREWLIPAAVINPLIRKIRIVSGHQLTRGFIAL